MKTIKLISLLVIFFISLNSGFATEIKQQKIILDKENYLLTAPKANTYQWYFNGKKLNHEGKTLRYFKSGTYKVVMTNRKGVISKATITLGVNSEGETYRIIITGDSTVQGWGGNPQEGWGATLKYYFNDNVTVINRARSARSARSYYYEDASEPMVWPNTRELIQPGDFVLIGFGINDASTLYDRYTDPFDTNEYTGYKWYLKQYIKETQARGGFPVIVTTVRRCRFNADGTVYDSYHNYPVASRQIAKEYNIPCIDLDSASVPLYEKYGYDYIAHFIHYFVDVGEYGFTEAKADEVHFQQSGCLEICKLVTDEIKKYANDTIINRLIPHIKPMYEVATSTNLPAQTQITRTQSFPAGAPVTVKVRIPNTFDLVRWEDGNGTTKSLDNIYRFTMGYEAISLKAIVDDDPQPDCAGVLNGFAYIDDCGECVEGTTGKLACNSETIDGIYKLTSVRTEFCIQEDTNEIIQKVCVNENSQFWQFIKSGYYYKIKNIASDGYLGADTLISGTPVLTGTEEMLWEMEKIGIDTFLFSPKENLGLGLEISGTTEGKYLRINTKNTLNRQQFRVWELDPNNCSGYPCTTTEIETNVLSSNYKIYPNPSSGSTVLELNTKGVSTNIVIYNIEGKKLIEKKNITEQYFNFGQELKEGLYIVKIISGNEIETLKFIKN